MPPIKNSEKQPLNDFSHHSRKIFSVIRSYIPVNSIKLMRLPDGYNISVNHRETRKDEKGSYEASFIYEIEEHYGIPVSSLHGGFNDQHLYEILIKFEEQ